MNKEKQAQISEILQNNTNCVEPPTYNRRNQCLQHAKLRFIQKTKTLICLNPNENDEEIIKIEEMKINKTDDNREFEEVYLNCTQKYKCNNCLIAQAETENTNSLYKQFWSNVDQNSVYGKNSHTFVLVHLETHIKNYKTHRIESYLNFNCLKLDKGDIKFHQLCRINIDNFDFQTVNLQNEKVEHICFHGIYKVSEQIIENNIEQSKEVMHICGYIVAVTCDCRFIIIKYLINLSMHNCEGEYRKNVDISFKCLTYNDTNTTIIDMNDTIIDLKVSSDSREFGILTQSGYLHIVRINEESLVFTVNSFKLNSLKSDGPDVTCDFMYFTEQPVFDEDDDMQVDSNSQMSNDESHILCVPIIGFDYGYANGIMYGITEYSIFLIDINK